MTRYKVGYLVGSLATASINRKLAKALIRLAPERLAFNEISFRDLHFTATIMTRIIHPSPAISRAPSRHPTLCCLSLPSIIGPFQVV